MTFPKIAFFDMDGTIAAPRYLVNDKYVIGFPADGWIDFCKQKQEHAYDECETITPVLEFAKQLKAEGCTLYILTVSLCTAEQAAKHAFIKKHHLGAIFDRCIFAKSDDEKLEVMAKYAAAHDLCHEECALVEDLYYTCLKAHQKGFTAIHLSNILTDTIVWKT